MRISHSVWSETCGRTYQPSTQGNTFVQTGTRLALAGLVFLATALSASAFFVTGLVFSDRAAVAVAAVAVGAIGGLWFGLPLWRKARG